MTNLVFGIIIGLFLYFAGERFLVFAKETLEDRKENEIRKTEEAMEKMIEKIINKKGE